MIYVAKYFAGFLNNDTFVRAILIVVIRFEKHILLRKRCCHCFPGDIIPKHSLGGSSER